jgi:hypothetical protein
MMHFVFVSILSPAWEVVSSRRRGIEFHLALGERLDEGVQVEIESKTGSRCIIF